jgi:hypothetical protein
MCESGTTKISSSNARTSGRKYENRALRFPWSKKLSVSRVGWPIFPRLWETLLTFTCILDEVFGELPEKYGHQFCLILARERTNKNARKAEAGGEI